MPINRAHPLVQKIDRMVAEGKILEPVMIQTGYSTYEPKHCRWQKLYPYQEMTRLVQEARIVITHGGPSSFIMPLQIGKIPVVVPRQKQYDEHVNDHQLAFAKALAERQGNLLVVEEIRDLENILINYSRIVASLPSDMKSNNAKFNEALRGIVEELFS